MKKDITEAFEKAQPKKPGRKKIATPSNADIWQAAIVTRSEKSGRISWKALAAFFGVSLDTLKRWRTENPEIDQIVEQAKHQDLMEIAAKARAEYMRTGNSKQADLYLRIVHPYINDRTEPNQVNVTQNFETLPTPKGTFKKPAFVIEHEKSDEPPSLTEKLFGKVTPEGEHETTGVRRT